MLVGLDSRAILLGTWGGGAIGNLVGACLPCLCLVTTVGSDGSMLDFTLLLSFELTEAAVLGMHHIVVSTCPTFSPIEFRRLC